MAHSEFVHLRVHTAYSLSEGAIRIKDLAKKCQELRFPAVAMTDTNSMAGAAEFTKVMTGAGIQPIIGSQLDLAHDDGDGQTIVSQVVVFAKDKAGYDNLVKLISSAYLRTSDGSNPTISFKDLVERQEGLILLTGGTSGPINRALNAGKDELAESRLVKLKEVFGDRVYCEIQRVGRVEEKIVEPKLVELADKHGIPLVATNEAFFLTPDMAEAHDVLLCIAQGAYLSTESRRRVSAQNYLRSAEEMRELFADIPDALNNTLIIAQRCASVFEKAKPMLPAFQGKDGLSEPDELRRQAQEGLEAKLAKLKIPAERHQEYRDRLAYELDVIIQMGFPGYFLIVADFINWAKSNDIPVGPGRGSGAGSLVAFCLGITDLDPIRFGLLFERFLNPDRVSMPDFDVDFCQARREEVIDYVKRRYGEDRVAQIGTIGKLQARAAVRDVGRVLQIPYPVVDRCCRMIPNNPSQPVTLAEAMEMEPLATELENADYDIKKMFDTALKLEGLYRHTSTHAAGVVIADRPVSETVPVMRDHHGAIHTQFDMKAVEEAGLVKFDFLGLKTLDIIHEACKLASEDGVEIDFDEIGDADLSTYEMLAEGDSYGVFQLESAGMRAAMRQIMPTNIDDVIALVSLYRPGPMENIPQYALVKHGKEEASYLHPMMEPILKDTYGIIIYQEQVMELAKKLAGYSLGQADLLRRAMGKKIKEEMDKQRAAFVEGCQAGWVEVELDDGRKVRLHSRLPVQTADGRTVGVQEAVEQGLDVLL
jgi:DNA polymerase-3 subunit alpha